MTLSCQEDRTPVAAHEGRPPRFNRHASAAVHAGDAAGVTARNDSLERGAGVGSAAASQGDAFAEYAAHDAVAAVGFLGDLANTPALVMQPSGVLGHCRSPSPGAEPWAGNR